MKEITDFVLGKGADAPNFNNLPIPVHFIVLLLTIPNNQPIFTLSKLENMLDLSTLLWVTDDPNALFMLFDIHF